MPYERVSDLPESVRALPAHGQEIFRAAFNAAFKQYGEERAFAIAWSAVKKKYRKQGDTWHAIQGAPREVDMEETRDESILDQNLSGNYDTGGGAGSKGKHGRMVDGWMRGDLITKPPEAGEANEGSKGEEKSDGDYFMKMQDGQYQLKWKLTDVPPLQQLDEAWHELLVLDTSVAQKGRLLAQLRGMYHAQDQVPPDARHLQASSEMAREHGHKSPPKGYPETKGEYADPKNFKYPIDTEEHVRAALAYINQARNASVYSSEELSAIKSRIHAAARKFGIAVAEKQSETPYWVLQGGDPPGGEEELHQTQSCVLQTESYDERSGIMRVSGVATTGNVINSKREVYPTEVWQDNLPRLQRMVQSGKLVGECDHPSTGRSSVDRTCLKFTELVLQDHALRFKGELIPTEPYGKNVIKLIQSGVSVDISSRGRGTKSKGTWNDVPDVNVVQRGYRCDGFDLVVAGASPNSTIESWEMAQSSHAGEATEEEMEALDAIAQQLKDLSAQTQTFQVELTAMKDAELKRLEAAKPIEQQQEETRQADRASKLEKLLIRERIESLVQEQTDKLPNQFLNMYRKLLTRSGGETVDALEAYSATALQIVQDTIESAPKMPGRGIVIQKSAGERGPQTPRELIETLVSDLPDEVLPGPLSSLQGQDDEMGVPDFIRSPRRQLRRILTNIASHKSGAWNGPAAIRGLLMMEQGHNAETVTDFLDQACADGTTAVSAGGAPTSAIFIFPLIRRVFPQLIATELASVQPMDRPEGKIFYLDAYRISTGVDSLDEAGATVTNRMRMDRSSSFNSSYSDDPGECNPATLLQLKLSSKSVTAQTKKLHAVWTIEELQDLRAYHGLDVASELVSSLSREIALEWNLIVLNELLSGQTAGNSNFGTTAPAGYTQKEWDEYLPRYLDKASTDIFTKRHGEATHVIAGPTAWLKLAAAFRVGTRPQGTNPEQFAGLTLTPFMSGTTATFQTYKTSFWTGVNSDKILVLRKGTDWSDTAYVWAPYVDYVSPTLTLPDVFTQKQGIMSRAAHKVVVGDAIASITIQAGVGVPL